MKFLICATHPKPGESERAPMTEAEIAAAFARE